MHELDHARLSIAFGLTRGFLALAILFRPIGQIRSFGRRGRRWSGALIEMKRRRSIA